ncbi:hypothetical protein B7P43_G06215 [Cryptotermes secundus]|uniref:Uncharacterized protein n=1 Tax=Cryptotermes secundus TaxID=105785 RepID=A0A2J7QN50_9NEOP|nr:hypothetical protein B7P43_G06215 [Cryptotermes secundus]
MKINPDKSKHVNYTLRKAWKVENLIRADRRVTIDTIATAICCSHGMAYLIMNDRLGFHKVCARWVPRMLTLQHKMQRMGLALQYLNHYHDEGNDMLARIVIGDESWVHHYQPETKRGQCSGNILCRLPKKKGLR